MAINQCPQEWSEWMEWSGAGLHGRCRWRLPILLGGILFATGPRTAASWLATQARDGSGDSRLAPGRYQHQ
jgi:hypothetical protein